MSTNASLTQSEFAEGLRHVGVERSSVVLVHSAMRTFGHIVGGAGTAVEALLETLGPSGTLVTPTFTFAHEAEADPVIDPKSDPSEMGAISEATRRHLHSQRSVAFRHSFAAIGRRAEVITQTDPALSPFDLRSSFGVMLSLNTQILLFGMTYSSSTSHHFAEWVCDVPYRHTISMTLKVRGTDGSIIKQPMMDYQPKSEGGSYYGSRGPDFHRLGRMLEERDLVGTTFIGNAAVRRYAMRDLIDLAQDEAARDHNIFRTPEGQQEILTPLTFGTVVKSPALLDGARRVDHFDWCVKDPAKLAMPRPTA